MVTEHWCYHDCISYCCDIWGNTYTTSVQPHDIIHNRAIRICNHLDYFKIHGHHQEGHQKECADGRQHSRPQELEIGSVQGDPLTWKSLHGQKVRIILNIDRTLNLLS